MATWVLLYLSMISGISVVALINGSDNIETRTLEV